MKPHELIPQFDTFLSARGLSFSAIAIGGAALSLMGIINRETRDCDILEPELPEYIKRAANEFAREIRRQGEIISDDWLNNGPEQLKQILPKGWSNRLVPLFAGKSLQLMTLGREDLLKSKLFAYCDRGTDLNDCILLNPTRSELIEQYDWLKVQDAHPKWANHVQDRLIDLGDKLGYGISKSNFASKV